MINYSEIHKRTFLDISKISFFFFASAEANQMLRKLWPTLKVPWLAWSVSGLFQHKSPSSPDTVLAWSDFWAGSAINSVEPPPALHPVGSWSPSRPALDPDWRCLNIMAICGRTRHLVSCGQVASVELLNHTYRRWTNSQLHATCVAIKVKP